LGLGLLKLFSRSAEGPHGQFESLLLRLEHLLLLLFESSCGLLHLPLSPARVGHRSIFGLTGSTINQRNRRYRPVNFYV
jgi:hypothetical protein